MAADDRMAPWPGGKRFAFTIFEDPDGQSLEQTREVYSFLSDLGLRTTIGAWMLEPGAARRNSGGETCQNPAYLEWLRELQRRGFEIGLHSVAPASMLRAEIEQGLACFRDFFGADPVSMANHYNADAMYWGDARLSGFYRWLYRAATRGSTGGRFAGQQEDSPHFWGDLCQRHVRYCRNFVFRELNTLKVCPMMPYRDPDRPYVNYWYASAEASNLERCLSTLTEESMDRLEAEGGACILYTHFAHGYFASGALDERFRALMTRLARKNGWFVPVKTLLGFLEEQGRGQIIAAAERQSLERRWLWTKLRHGTS